MNFTKFYGNNRTKVEKIILFGNTELAGVAYFYLTYDSPYEVAAFTVDQSYIKEKTFFGLPVVPFETVENIFPPVNYKMVLMLSFARVNKFRAEKYSQAKSKGYQLIRYVSSRASTWPGLIIGENSIISEGCVISPFVEVGNNVFIAPGCIVGHNSIVKDHCFLAAHTVVLGNVTIEPYCVLGANSTIRDGITINRECIIAAGGLITKDTHERGVYLAKSAELAPKPSNELGTWLSWNETIRRSKRPSR
jgi:sugar O-acyltransferase (sialic acid O-acetyltransferase NeuD family)